MRVIDWKYPTKIKSKDKSVCNYDSGAIDHAHNTNIYECQGHRWAIPYVSLNICLLEKANNKSKPIS